MSATSSKAAGVPNLATQLVEKILENYTTRSPRTLLNNYKSYCHESFRFVDPFVDASPRQEALLQFLSLQKIFSKITATPTDIRVEDSKPGTEQVKFHCSFEYFWAREGRFTKWLLPEKTDIEATVCLTVDQIHGKVIEHEEIWRSPSVPKLPTALLKLNAKVTNAGFRLLGWEKELTAAEADLAMGKEDLFIVP